MKFNTAYQDKRDEFAQNFDINKITETKCGQTYNVFDRIQAANIDTDIKEVLRKYGCTIDEGVEYMKRRGGMQGIFADISKLQERAQSLPELHNIQREAQETFDQLPTEVKQKYGNNLEEFLKAAENFAKNQKKETATTEVAQEAKHD